MLEEFAQQVAKAIGDLPSNFMLDSATYEYGNSIGFDGLDFYVCGRGGALGDVPAGVCAAAFVFFNPAMITVRWERGGGVMDRSQAADHFASCLHRWALQHLDDGVDYERLGSLLGKLCRDTSPAGAPLFAGWLARPEPDDPAALALHRLNGLRELRGALHGGAVLAAGLDPLVAVLVRTPIMARVFGWTEPYPDVGLAKECWAAAEAATNRAMGRVFSSLEPSELDLLADLLGRAHSGVH